MAGIVNGFNDYVVSDADFNQDTGSLIMTCETVENHESVVIYEREELSEVQQKAYQAALKYAQQFAMKMEHAKRVGSNVVVSNYSEKIGTDQVQAVKKSVPGYAVPVKSQNFNQANKQIVQPQTVNISNINNVTTKVPVQIAPPSSASTIVLNSSHSVSTANIGKPLLLGQQTLQFPSPIATTPSTAMPKGSYIILRPQQLNKTNAPIRTIILPNPSQMPLDQPLYIRLPGMMSQQVTSASAPPGISLPSETLRSATPIVHSQQKPQTVSLVNVSNASSSEHKVNTVMSRLALNTRSTISKRPPSSSLYKCSACPFFTTSGNDMAQHLILESHTSCTIRENGTANEDLGDSAKRFKR